MQGWGEREFCEIKIFARFSNTDPCVARAVPRKSSESVEKPRNDSDNATSRANPSSARDDAVLIISHTDRYLSARQYASKDKTTRNDKAARHSSNKPSQNCVVQQTQSTKHLAPQSQHEAQGTTHHICRRFQPSSCASPSLRKCKHEWAGLAGEGIPRRTAAADFDSKRGGREGVPVLSSPSIWINYPKIGSAPPPLCYRYDGSPEPYAAAF